MERATIQQLLSIAASQVGLFSVDQAAGLGVTEQMLRQETERGWIGRERRRVYRVAGAPSVSWQPSYAAALASGPPAAISHSSAATIHAMFGIAAAGVEITVPMDHSRCLKGVTVHRSRTLLATDTELRRGVAITTPIRTLIDLAGRFDEPLLGKIVDEGVISRLWRPETISARLNQLVPSTAGSKQLRSVLAIRLGEGHPDSQLEQRVVRVVKRSFPGYEIHYQVVLSGDVIVMDIAWPAQRIGAEVDGMAVRAASRSKFERTCRRENLLVAHGWRVVHLTAQMDERDIVAQLAPLFSS